ILADRHRARLGSYGVVPGTSTGRPCVLLSATATPPATVSTSSASVLVSKKASNARERGESWPKQGGSPAGPNEPSDGRNDKDFLLLL
ncbi:hypothetical protein OAQ34_12300, partial [Opitutales bacterium]|nr:hypothetical protein [Opitutales bacterium]